MRSRFNLAPICVLLAVCVTLQGCFTQDQAEQTVNSPSGGVVAEACNEYVRDLIDQRLSAAMKMLQHACNAMQSSRLEPQCFDTGSVHLREVVFNATNVQTGQCVAKVNSFTKGIVNASYVKEAIKDFKSRNEEKIRAEVDALFNDVHSFLNNAMTDLSNLRAQLEKNEDERQAEVDALRKELEHEQTDADLHCTALIVSVLSYPGHSISCGLPW